VADPIWWKEQNEVSIYCLVLFSPSSKITWHNSYVIYFQAMPGCISFRDAPLEHEEQMRIVFHAISDKNETSFVPIISGVGGVATLRARGKNNLLSPQMTDPLLRKGQLPLPPWERRRRLLEISV
jgi:hypothetical protein